MKTPKHFNSFYKNYLKNFKIVVLIQVIYYFNSQVCSNCRNYS